MSLFIKIPGSLGSPATRLNDSGELLKKATAQKSAGNITGAIELLRQFWLDEPFGTTGYGIESFLKLPMYLQQAGRRDEAWQALNVLMSDFVLSTEKLNHQVLPMMHSEICDKMRLFWQREGETAIAVKYGIVSHVHWLLGLHRQRRVKELRESSSRETIESVVKPLLKKAKKLHRQTPICDLVETEVHKLPRIDVHFLGCEVDRLVLA